MNNPTSTHTDSSQQSPSSQPPKNILHWKWVAFILVYTVLVKLLPYVLFQYGMDVEKNFAIYPWNFTPMFAVCLFGGAFYQSRISAVLIPLGLMLIADLGIWAVTGKADWAFYGVDQFVVYGALALCAAIGFLLRNRRRVQNIAFAGVASCLSFYLITNFAVWLGSTTYPQDAQGLLACYIAALPTLRNSLIATGLFSAVLFSPMCVSLTAPATRSTATLTPAQSA
ncbi:hypothetical protein KOR42_29220 [Thalassoglobus neptunius]|uniref:Uncharacterized protein n=1 Tax=Thalassoglobus neptunius TaxID=1938619 RepID=A0A5C5WWF8_9PLAN|nr:DUF6580 family putative transport protein [Thalassoglobus neptunius]TWT55294.1 hypothetical protein KOR42_29220 [Thalassoglobus neptunius]